MKTKLILGAGALAIAALAILAMTLVTTGIVNAQTPTNTTGTSTTPAAPTAPAAGSPVHLDGKVASVNAASIVVTTRSGDVTANISANTYIVVNKNGTAATGAITDLAAGEVVNVVGQATTDAKVVDAKLVTQGGPFRERVGVRGNNRGNNPGNKVMPGNRNPGNLMMPQAAAGKITAINGDSVTLEVTRGSNVASLTVNTSANTLVLNSGFTTLNTLKVGDSVQVLGEPARPVAGTSTTPPQGRTINAWAIRVDNGTTTIQMAHVATVSGNTITTNSRPFKTAAGTIINFDSNTKFKSLTLTIGPGGNTYSFADASQADVQANSNIVVEGVASADGTSFTAQAVIILPSRGPFDNR